MNSFQALFNENNQEIIFIGSIRPSSESELMQVEEVIDSAISKSEGTLYLNCKRLRFMNNKAFIALVKKLRAAGALKQSLKVKVIISSIMPWAAKRLKILEELISNTSVEQYDDNFYPGQHAIDKMDFIHVLRTQTKLIWKHEEPLLRDHGLSDGMKVADICCGIGDFVMLLKKNFDLKEIVAVDHSKQKLAYARDVAQEFGISDIDFQQGDASELLLEDNKFDFVTCRLSLQIFDRPKKILDELVRICKPGGVIYMTNENYSNVSAFPSSENVKKAYREACSLFKKFDMDLDFGLKMNSVLREQKLENIHIKPLTVYLDEENREDFAEVVDSWKSYIANELATAANCDEEYKQELHRFFDDHKNAIKSEKGFSSWPIWSASARKPLK